MSLLEVKELLRIKKRKFRRLALESSDFAVVSFPKSGRTWLRNILSIYWQQLYKVPVDYEFGLNRASINDKVTYPRVCFTHNYFDYFQDINFDLQHLIDLRFLKHKKPIYVTRHPLDVLVSYYYQKKYREKVTTIAIEDFFADNVYGIERLCCFLLKLLKEADGHLDAEIISYEQLSSVPFDTIQKLLVHWELEVDSSSLHSALMQSSFDVMRSKELETIGGKSLSTPSLRLGGYNENGDPRAFKVRSGKVGGHIEELDLSLIKKAESIKTYQQLMFEYEKRHLLVT